jgi:D-xylose transport system permease protein
VTTTETTPIEKVTTEQRTKSLGEALGDWWGALRGGEVGYLPVILGLVVIVVYFQAGNSNFLTAGNFVNLIVQMSGPTVIAVGVVFVLLLGEIDLSAAIVSGIGGVVAAEFLLNRTGVASGLLAILIAMATGVGIGLLQGIFIAKIGVPSFVVTLAGLLAWQGVLLLIIGEGGTVVIQNQTIFNLANYSFPDWAGWLIGGIAIALFLLPRVGGYIRRYRAGLPIGSPVLFVLRSAFVVAAIIAVIAVCNQDRGFPLAGLIVIALIVIFTYVAERTTFGRHVYAVGGSAEAARRAGIGVDRIKLSVFMLASGLAGLGGVILASRLSSVDPNAGGSDLLLNVIAAAVIGGTSLFGGRGRVIDALLGSLVIYAVANGMGLLEYSSGVQFLVTGIILLAAVTVDTLSRRRLAVTGR